jgi:aspartate-semialdehyde dehydrogenase
MSSKTIAIGILGATGTVGQRFIELLEKHPIFYVKALGASERSAGKPFKEACNWKMTTEIPKGIAEKEGIEINKIVTMLILPSISLRTCVF